MKRTLLAVVVLAAVAVVWVFFAPASGATGKVKCDVGTAQGADVTVAVASVDPIVAHNASPSAHQHDFFGNRLVPSLGGGGTWEQVVGNSTTTCRLPGDTAGYWAPSLVYTKGPKAGQRVPVQQFTAYYRGFAGQDVDAGSRAFPAGVRLVASDGAGYGLSGWTCGQNSGVTGGQQTIPNCTSLSGKPGYTLTAHVNFPSCWNGNLPNHPGDPGRAGQADSEHGDTRDNADWAYPSSKKACPAAFPIEVVQLRETVQYAYTGDGTDVALTSDLGAPAGSSFHVDFWNTWQPGALEDFTARCVNTPAEANCDL